MARWRVIVDVLCLAILAWSAGCGAVDTLTLELAGATGNGWSTGAVRLALVPGNGGELGLDLSAKTLRLPAPLSGLERVDLRCPGVIQRAGGLRCERGKALVQPRRGDALNLVADVDIDLAAGVTRLTLPEQAISTGRLSLSLLFGGGDFSLEVKATELDMAWLASLSQPAGEVAPLSITAGRLSGALRMESTNGAARASGKLRSVNAAFSDATGERAGENLQVELNAELARRGTGWQGNLRLSIDDGALYVAPLLVDAAKAPLRVQLRDARLGNGALEVPLLEVAQDGVLHASGAARIVLDDSPRLARLSLDVPRTTLEPVYQAFIRPFVVTGPLSNLSLEGEAALQLDWGAGSPSALSLSLHGLNLGDRAGDFAFVGLDGTIEWRDRLPVAATRLRLEAAQLGPLSLGRSRLDAALQGRTARLLDELVVPVLDGKLRVARLDATELGTPEMRLEIDTALDPISMQALSERMAWLPLSGTLSGRVPAMVYENGRLRVEGDLDLELFQGRVRIAGLTVAHPFSAVPEIRANVELEALSLNEISRSLSFGSIEGRLSGHVTGLVMEGLRPVAFDAFLATPEDDDSRHRISQRAVDNLASLGGAGAVLSSTFLRFFESFSYQRLGLGCRLKAGVCLMRGVEEARDGYYIVKGGGLPPRVNVVGYNREVSWDTLLERLRAVANSAGPIVR